MAIPGFQEMTLPFLKACVDGQEWSMAAIRSPIAEHFGLTQEARKEMLPNGFTPRFHNRVAWAKVYLERAGLIATTRRGHFRITPAGEKVLGCPPDIIDIRFLSQFEQFNKSRSRKTEPAEPPEDSQQHCSEEETPEEQLQAAHQRLCDELASQLLTHIDEMSFEFFEKLVLDLMLAMGYGGSREESGSLTHAGADEGIDGIINEDQLGLDTIYLQAKKWRNPVGRPEIHKFVGALHGRRARKGVFLTTSFFTRDAVEYAKTVNTKVVLVDGQRLSQLMIKHGVGCKPSQSFVVMTLDSDYFAEE